MFQRLARAKAEVGPPISPVDSMPGGAAGLSSAPKVKLLDQVRRECRLRHYSLRTEEAYVSWSKRFIVFHGKRHPRDMGALEVRAFLEHLANEGRVASATQHQAASALLFLYLQVLKVELAGIGEALRRKRPTKLPVVLTRAEVQRLLDGLEGTHQLIGRLL